MNEITKEKKKVSKIDRVALSSNAIDRMDKWLAALSEHYQGIKLRRNDLTSWLILNHRSELSVDEIKGIGAEFYDETQFAQWIVRRLKEAKATGKSISIQELMRCINAKKEASHD